MTQMGMNCKLIDVSEIVLVYRYMHGNMDSSSLGPYGHEC